MTLWSFKTYGYICSKTKSYQIQRRFLFLFIFLPDLGLQAACFPILSLRLHAFRSFTSGRMPSGSSTNLPKPRILDPFQQSKPPVCQISHWLRARKPAWQHRSQVLSCYYIATTGAIKYHRAVLVASNKPYSHHPYGGSKGLRLYVKLLTRLGLIYMIIKSSARNCKAIRGDLDPQPNQIKEGRFPTNGKMVGWRWERFPTNGM